MLVLAQSRMEGMHREWRERRAVLLYKEELMMEGRGGGGGGSRLAFKQIVFPFLLIDHADRVSGGPVRQKAAREFTRLASGGLHLQRPSM